MLCRNRQVNYSQVRSVHAQRLQQIQSRCGICNWWSLDHWVSYSFFLMYYNLHGSFTPIFLVTDIAYI
jgi:hypothetical protein